MDSGAGDGVRAGAGLGVASGATSLAGMSS